MAVYFFLLTQKNVEPNCGTSLKSQNQNLMSAKTFGMLQKKCEVIHSSREYIKSIEALSNAAS